MQYQFKSKFRKLKKIDLRVLKEEKKIEINIGLAVVSILCFSLFLCIAFSVYKFRHNMANKPEKTEKIVHMQRPAPQPAKVPVSMRGKQGEQIKVSKEKAILPKKVTARVAIILDDAGGTVPDYYEISTIREPLTISVIPDLPTSRGVAKTMASEGFEIMLHLPMEPLNGNYSRSGAGMVTCSDSDNEIRKTMLDDLSSVKWAVGFNNHMGSKATADARVMKEVFNAVKGRGLYFIDSRTSDRSIALKVAKNSHIPSAENNIFLDSETGRNNVEINFRRLISMAKQKGSAIGIGHATRPATISVLKELMPIYANDGVKFVHASELVR